MRPSCVVVTVVTKAVEVSVVHDPWVHEDTTTRVVSSFRTVGDVDVNKECMLSNVVTVSSE